MPSGYDAADTFERTPVDVRIGVTQSARDINLELADDLDRNALKAQIDAAITGAVDVLWLTDKKGRDIAVAASKIAFVELGNRKLRVQAWQPDHGRDVTVPPARTGDWLLDANL